MKLFSSLGQELYQLKALQNCLLSELTSFVSSQVSVMACLQRICHCLKAQALHLEENSKASIAVQYLSTHEQFHIK